MELRGGCHCGNVTYRLDWPEADGPRRARFCTCSFCTKHNNHYISHSEASLAVTITEPARIIRYSFATGTAAFLICGVCGVIPVVVGEQDGTLLGVVNADTLEDFDLPEPPIPLSFDGETLEERLARRKKYWIGRVKLEERAAT